jgi:hypothetical protein
MSGKIKLNTSKVILNTDKIVFGTPVKTWVFIETSADSTLYPLPRAVIVAGASGCATVGEGLAGLESSFPAVDQTLGRYGRVTVYEPGLVPCGYFHWYTVELV